ncbi:MAG: DUF4124 domain-containing protein [Proteobacteria bacterium]|nr:DUF4124 domain-containing protein [Pseudomonadota bacterium]
MTFSFQHPAGAALAVAIFCSVPAAAQVVRCTDPATGKITYTDGDCRRGEAAREVEARKSPQEIAQEREQAAEALQRKQERLQLEDRQRREEQLAERAARAAQPSAAYDPAQSPQCQRARKQLQDLLPTLGQGLYDEQARLDAAQRQADLACLSPAEYARTERSRSYRSIYTSPYYTRPTVVVPPRPMPAPPQREIANCNVFRCYDGKGNTYPR